MNINRHNYESFFLLYVDNELSAADRKAVELFVQENPDLEAELSLLQESILLPEVFHFDKSTLLKTEDFSALQEKLILYGDKELDSKAMAEVEALLKTDKALAAEWTILQNTRLEADADIVYADKQSLYRREPARIITVKWWRIAAAAVLLGFGTWTGISLYMKANKTGVTDPSIASNIQQPVPQDVNNNNNLANNTTTGNTNTNASDPADPANTATVVNNNTGTDKNRNTNTNTIQRPITGNEKQPNEDIAANKAVPESNNLPRPYFENINNKERNTIATPNVPTIEDNSRSGTALASNSPNVQKENQKLVDVNNSATNANPYAKVASADENMNYLQEDDKNKRTKIGGLFRKVRRVLERTANIKTGDGIQIAGFEIAAK